MPEKIAQIAAQIKEPIPAICLFAVLVLVGFIFNNWYKLRKFRSIPEDQRYDADKSWLEKGGFDLSGQTKEQIQEIAKMEFARRGKNQRLLVLLMVLSFILLLVVMVLSYVFSDPVQKPKEAFNLDSTYHANSPAFPEDLFGSPQDDLQKPRLWMRCLESGAKEISSIEDEKQKSIWLWTETFPAKTSEFTVYLNTGTNSKVLGIAFLVEPGDPPRASALRQSKKQESTNRLLQFEVPQSSKHSRLVFFLTLKSTKPVDQTQFRVCSTPEI